MVTELAHAIPVKARIYDQPKYSGKITIASGTDQSATIELSGQSKWIDLPQLNFSPEHKVKISGNFKSGRSFFEFAKSGSNELQVLDLGAIFKPLRSIEKPISERWKLFLDNKEKFENENSEIIEDAKTYIMAGDKNSAEEVALAEKRLGYSLPVEFKDLLMSYGPSMIDDHAFTDAKSIDNGMKQMEVEWGTPKEALDRYPETAKLFFQSSVILFTFSGDGYGALVYLPRDIKNTKAGYYNVHQDTIDDPELISAAESKSAFTDAIVWVLRTIILESLESSTNAPIYIDSSSKESLPLVLEPDSNAENFGFVFSIDWEKLN